MHGAREEQAADTEAQRTLQSAYASLQRLEKEADTPQQVTVLSKYVSGSGGSGISIRKRAVPGLYINPPSTSSSTSSSPAGNNSAATPGSPVDRAWLSHQRKLNELQQQNVMCRTTATAWGSREPLEYPGEFS